MTAIDGCAVEINAVKQANQRCLAAADEENRSGAAGRRARAPLPWIGALPNLGLGPMLVVNDSGYLVPLFTAVDLLRGCRSFWQPARD